MKVELNVKDKSVEAFLAEKMVDFPTRKERGCGDQSVHSLLKDELIFKKDCGLLDDEVLKIELCDYGAGSRKTLINRYTYTAESYDDFSILLRLTDFKVEATDKKFDFNI